MQPGSMIYKSYTHKGKATQERQNKEKGVSTMPINK